MKALTLILALGIMAISLPALADDCFIDQTIDVLSGRHDQCETWGYAAYTTKDVVKVMGVPVLPKGFRIKAATVLGQDFLEVNKVEMGIEF